MRTTTSKLLLAAGVLVLAGCGNQAVETAPRTSSEKPRNTEITITDERVYPAFSTQNNYYVTHCPDGELRFKASGVTGQGQEWGYSDGEIISKKQTGESLFIDGLEIRCIPQDMPLPKGSENLDLGGPVLLSTTLNTNSDAFLKGMNPYLILLDKRGAPVWWRSGSAAEGHAEFIQRGEETYLLSYTEDGESKAIFSHLPGSGYVLERLRNDGSSVVLEKTETFAPDGIPLDFHDGVLTESGLIGLYYKIDREERETGLSKMPDMLNIGLGARDLCAKESYKNARTAVAAVVYVGEKTRVIEIQHSGLPEPTGALWHSPTGDAKDCVIDIDHPNAVDVHDGFDVVTLRHRDAIVAIDQDGEVLWSVGGKNGPKRLEIVGDPLGGPIKPHDGRLDGGVLTLFDNHTGKPETRVVSYRLDLSKKTATMIYEGRARCADKGCSAFAMGSARKTERSYIAAMGTSDEISVAVLDDRTGEQLGHLWFEDYWSYRAVPVQQKVLELMRRADSK